MEVLDAELARDKTWEAGNGEWRRVLLWMAVQGRHSDDERIQTIVKQRWDNHGAMFAEVGIRADGELTGTLPGDLPGSDALIASGVKMLFSMHFAGMTNLGVRWVLRIWGEQPATVKRIPLKKLQKKFGGTLFGVRLDGIEDVMVSGEATIGVNPRHGELVFTVPERNVPTLSWGGTGPAGAVTVTARGADIAGLEFASSWPANSNIAEVETMSAALGELRADSIVTTTGGRETARATDFRLQHLGFQVELGPLREGGRIALQKLPAHLEQRLHSPTTMLAAAVGALTATASSSATGTQAAFLEQLRVALLSGLDDELYITTAKQAAPGAKPLPPATRTAGDIVVPGIGSVGGIDDLAFDLEIAAGPRALARLRAGPGAGRDRRGSPERTTHGAGSNRTLTRPGKGR